MYPFLSLAEVTLDDQLAQRLPRRLAYYHLVLPIAQDDEGITVAMANPENRQVVAIIEAALQTKVIPVRSPAEAIRQRLDQVWQAPSKPLSPKIVCWIDQPEPPDVLTRYLADWLATPEMATTIEYRRNVEIDPATIPAADLLVAATAQQNIPESLFHGEASLLILPNLVRPPSAILHILRGHIPDRRVLDWLMPLAEQRDAEITLFVGTEGDGQKTLSSDLTGILTGQDKRHAHIAECRQTLNAAGVTGRLKIREGALLAVIQEELAENCYDLIAIAAEAYGDFAYQVWQIIHSGGAAFLVIKP